jgi:lipopolysaccharide export system protein LptC
MAEKTARGTHEAAQQAKGTAGFRFRPGSLARAPETLSILRYSRFVGWAKLLLPTAAACLIVVLASWPYFSASITRLRVARPVLDARMIQDLRMLEPHYSGIDKEQRPFTVTAKTARQTSQDDDLMALEAPKANIKSREGSWIVVTGDTGIYQSAAKYLDLSGHVQLFQDKGYVFHTDAARVNLDDGTTEGHDPVTGKGPGGTITGQGFHASHDGESVIFTGHTQLNMNAAGKKS